MKVECVWNRYAIAWKFDIGSSRSHIIWINLTLFCNQVTSYFFHHERYQSMSIVRRHTFRKPFNRSAITSWHKECLNIFFFQFLPMLTDTDSSSDEDCCLLHLLRISYRLLDWTNNSRRYTNSIFIAKVLYGLFAAWLTLTRCFSTIFMLYIVS